MATPSAKVIVGLTGCLLIAAIVGVMLWLSWSETPSTRYATRRDAEIARAFA
jgi:multidrug resistance efflux pump